jgi:hypothetical protein
VALIVDDDVQMTTTQMQIAVLPDGTELAEFVHEEVRSGARRLHPFGQDFLADSGNDRLQHSVLADVNATESPCRSAR